MDTVLFVEYISLMFGAGLLLGFFMITLLEAIDYFRNR